MENKINSGIVALLTLLMLSGTEPGLAQTVQLPASINAVPNGEVKAPPVWKLSGRITQLYGRTAMVRQGQETELAVDQNGLATLTKGELLISAFQTTIVRSDRYTMVVPKGTIAIISNENRVVKIRNLWEARPGSLFVQVSKKLLPVASGEELVLALDWTALQAAVAKDQIVRRKVELYDLSCGGSLMRSEFWPMTLINRSSVLREVAHSKDPTDKILTGKILKMAACLAVAKRGHGAYAYMTD